MPVDIYIIIIGVDGAHQFGIVAHLHSPTLVDGTFLIVDYPLIDGTVVDSIDVGRLTALGINHGPDAAPVAIDLAIIADNCKITTGEIAHG